MFNIWNLDDAVTLRDKIRRRTDAMRAVRHGNPILVRTKFPDVDFDLHSCFLMAEFRVRLNTLLQDEIDQCKIELRKLGIDPDASPESK